MSDPGQPPLVAVDPASFDAAELLDVLPDTVLVLDQDTRVVWANKAAERFFGRTLEEGVGTSAMEFIHPEDLQMAHLSFETVRGKDAGSLVEVRLLASDGWRLVEVRGAPFDDGVVLTARDITARRRWELTSNEVEQSRALLQNSATITFLIDADATVVASGGAVPRLLGLDPERLEGRGFDSIVDPQDAPALKETLGAIMAPGSRSASVDLRMIDADGGVVPHAMTFTNLLDDPTVAGVLVSGHDVSDRVQVEERLREAVSALAATLESTADAVLVVSSEGNVTCNRRFGKMWGLDPDTVTGMSEETLLVTVASQLVEPARISSMLDSIRADRELETHGSVELIDGRVIEGDSLPQYVHGRVTGRVWTFRDVTEERRLRDQLAHQAFHDSLTGLANQALLHDRLRNAAARLERSGGELALLYIDLDDFKAVNDTLGHHIGDDLLVGISRRIEGCLRSGDTAARLGGDEFAVLLDDLVDRADARRVAERITAALRIPTSTAAGEIAVRASIGIAYGDANTPADDVVRNADRAMYEAKGAGRNSVREFSPEMLSAAIRPGRGLDLSELIARGELDLVYQPVFQMPSRRVVALEALLRWNHPTRGVLHPHQFLDMATGLAEVDRFVLERACSDAVDWYDATPSGDVAVSVNLSGEQLADPALASLVDDTLRATGLPPRRLMIDVAENVLMTDPDAAKRQFDGLVGLGVRVAMDDFGTGATSLAHLAELPIEVLKIHRSFLTVTLREDRRTVLEALLMVTSSLGVLPIAEGVESLTEVEGLLELGCSTMQGYYLSLPLERHQVVEFLTGERCDVLDRA